MTGHFLPQKMVGLVCGLMEETYVFHKTLWAWTTNDKGYLIVTKKAVKPRYVPGASK